MERRRSIPRYLLGLGLAIAIGYLAVALLGWRKHTTILSGTFATGNPTFDALRGLAYLAMYFGVVVFAPICAIAAGVLVGFEKLRRRQN